jgi:maleamate amidohydrolase
MNVEQSSKTARELYEALKSGPVRKGFGFGKRPALVNVDVQHAYTRPDEFSTAYETDPRQIEYIDRLAKLMRERDLPVVWTHVAYSDPGDDRGVRGTRSNNPEPLQNIMGGGRAPLATR